MKRAYAPVTKAIRRVIAAITTAKEKGHLEPGQFSPADRDLAIRLLAILDEEDGIGPSMASAILHFIQPEYFPIIDERVVATVCKLANARRLRQPLPIDLKLAWPDYCELVHEKVAAHGFSVREMEMALYADDIAERVCL